MPQAGAGESVAVYLCGAELEGTGEAGLPTL